MSNFSGTDGNDEVRPGYVSSGVLIYPAGATPGSGVDYLDGWDGDDLLDGGGGDDVLNGGDGNDTLYGGDGNDKVYDDYGSDTLYGGRGDDRLSDWLGNNSVYGGGGDDVLWAGDDIVKHRNELHGGSGDDTLTALKGADHLYGDAGADDLHGAWGRDILEGGKGSDRLDGGRADDKLTGGVGNDEFVFDRPRDGGDIITDFHNGSGDNDRILIDASGFGVGLRTGGYLSSSQFQTSSGHEAKSAAVLFIFDTTDRTLWFDQNGSAAGGLSLLAELQNGAEVTHNDIWLV